MKKIQVKSAAQTKMKDRLQNIRKNLEQKPELSYNDRPKATIPKASAWDNFTQFDQFSKLV